MDEAIRPISSCGADHFTLYHLHERYDDRTPEQQELGVTHDTECLLVLLSIHHVHSIHDVQVYVILVHLYSHADRLDPDGPKGWGMMVLRDGWKYAFLAACDVEGNFLVVKAYQYTDLLSCMLLDAWAIPVCLFFSWIYFRRKYHWTQILGVFICIGGLGMLVASDRITQKDWEPSNRGKGDAFMIAGATLYGFTNATEELFVRKRPLYEVVGQLGMFGFIICSIQAAGLEHAAMHTASWNGAVVGLILAYTAAMIILYTLAPLLYRMASSAYYNLSLLTSDFWGLLFGLFLYHYHPYWLYFIAFAVVILGLITYFWHDTRSYLFNYSGFRLTFSFSGRTRRSCSRGT